MNLSLSLSVVNVDMEEFTKEICYGLSKSEIHNELKVVDNNIIFSVRMFLRSVDIRDNFVESYFKIFSKTKSKRIRKKYSKKIENRLNLYVEGLSYCYV